MTVITGQSQGDRVWAAMPLIERARPAFWLCIDPPGDAAARIAGLGVKLLVRHYGPWDDGDPGVVAPAEFVADCARQSWFAAAWGVLTPVMPHPGDPNWMAECVTRFGNLGKECVVGNWGTGWDGFPVPGATYYGCQEYGWPTILSEQPWQALRHRSWFPAVLAENPSARLFITETGITALQAANAGQLEHLASVNGAPHGADIGWRGGYGVAGVDGGQYAAGVVDYANTLTAEGYVLALFLYFAGAGADWASFEILGDPRLEGLIAPGGSQPPPGTGPGQPGPTPTPTPTPQPGTDAAPLALLLILAAGVLAAAQAVERN